MIADHSYVIVSDCGAHEIIIVAISVSSMQKKTYGSAKIFKGVETDICTYYLRLQKSAKTCEQNDLTCLGAKNNRSELKEFGRLLSQCSKKGKLHWAKNVSTSKW